MSVVALFSGFHQVWAADTDWHAAFSRAQQYYQNRQFSEAIDAAEAALHIAEGYVDPEGTEVCEILSFLGTLYRTSAAFDEQPKLNRRAIVCYRRVAAILSSQHDESAKQQLASTW